MGRNRKIKIITLTFLIIAVLGLTVAFATMSGQLTINGSGSVTPSEFDVHFENLKPVNLVGEAQEINAPVISNDAVAINNINISLKKPSDEAIYKVDIVNGGDIDAEIASIVLPELTNDQKKLFSFTARYDDDKEITEGDVLPVGATEHVTISIMYRSDISKYDLPSEAQSLNISYKINYVQTDLNALAHNGASMDTKIDYEFYDVTGKVGDNARYYYTSDGALKIKGYGPTYDGMDSSENIINYNGNILNDILIKSIEKAGITLTDEQISLFTSDGGLGPVLYGSIFNEETYSIISADNEDFKQALIEFGFTEEQIPVLVQILTSIPRNTSVTIDNGISSLGAGLLAFTFSENLVIPNSVTKYSPYCLMNAGISNLTLSKNAKNIPEQFIENYNNSGEYTLLSSLTIPNGVETIGERAFTHNEIINLTIPNSVTSIGSQAFRDNKIANLTLSNNLETIESYTFADNNISNISLPNSLKSIGDSAFANNGISSITIPSSVKSIGNYAFVNNGISSITIPNTLTSIGIGTFSNNPLEYVELNSTVTSTYSSNSSDLKPFRTTANSMEVVIGDSVTSIPDYMFYASKVTTLTIGDNVTNIGGYAFSSNPLEHVTLNSTVTNSYTSADRPFASTANTMEVVIENNVTSIPIYMFYNSKVTTLTIGDNVTSIGASAFENNSITSITIPSSVTSIGASAFANNSITSITIPSSVTSIENYAFANNSITSLTIPSSVTSIGISAFANNSITSITIPSSVTSIGLSAFANNSITNLTIPDNVTSIGASAFENNSISSLTIGRGLTSISSSTFGSNPITYLSLNSNVTNSYNSSSRPFATTANAMEVVIGNNVTNIPTYMFYNSKVTTLTIGDNVTSIGDSAFRNNSITSVTLPSGVEEIGEGAFYDNNITSLTLPNSLTTLDLYAFGNNPLAYVYLNSNIENTYTNSDEGPFIENSAANGLTVEVGTAATAIPNNTFYGANVVAVTINGVNKTRFNTNWDQIPFPSNLMPSNESEINSLTNDKSC